MTELSQAFPAIELTPNEIGRFPARLREKIEVRNEPPDKQHRLQRWTLSSAASRQETEVMCATATMARRIAGRRRKKLTERNIEALVDLYLDGKDHAAVDRELEQENAELHARYFREVPTYTAADIHELMHGSQLRNPSEPASRWKREKRVFAVQVDRHQRFPRFQFADGRPRPIIKEVMKRLPADMSPWQTACRFWSGNGWLHGKSTEEALNDKEVVLNAADRLRNPAIG